MKRKVTLYFMLIILLTLGLVLVSFEIGIRHYFYQDISSTFQNYVEAVTPVWERQADASHLDLASYSDDIIKSYRYPDSDLSLLSREGDFLQSSRGVYKKEIIPIDSKVMKYKTVYKVEKDSDYKEKILAVYTPLEYDGHVVGVLRYVTSLQVVNRVIFHYLSYAIGACGLIALLVFLVSIHLGNSIVKPLQDIIHLTKRMAEGNFKEKIEKQYPYEAGELVEMLNYMGDEIIKTDKLKNEFISSISHELRTPLTGIKGWIETMREPGGIEEDAMQFGLEIISNETERLIHLVEALLDFSRYQSDRVTLSLKAVNIEKLVQEVVFQLQKKAERKEIIIKVETRVVTLWADGDRLKQVLLNILDNAIKFSRAQTVIHVNQSIEDDTVEISVTDTGIGMKEEDLVHITKSFYKIDSKTVGEGLGLAISQRIIDLHEGQLYITSEYGKRTSVIVRLPIREPK